MKYLLTILLAVILSYGVSAKLCQNIKSGQWNTHLILNEDNHLPFFLEVISSKKNIPELTIKNGDETISLLYLGSNADTLIYEFPAFESKLHVVFSNKTHLSGYWINLNKKGRYTIPLEGHYCEGSLFSCQNTEQSSVQISPRWKTVFSPETDGAFPALGLFNQEGNKLSGTFLTETGDYRYLAGNVVGEKIFLSCFDGSHAFLFTATLKDGELNGKFFSGKHYQTTWIATADDNYELTDPDELTYLVNDEPLAFSFNDLKGEPVSYPSKAYKDKVTIIQIMGSWCPNCMDETRYYLELYDKYHDQGLEIILIGYEAGQNEEEYAFKLKRLQERYKVPFTMLVGGAANKNEASEDFSMLNSIISFPTSIFIDKEGKIVKIHTGFNGPGTGKYYEDYTLETQSFLESLLR